MFSRRAFHDARCPSNIVSLHARLRALLHVKVRNHFIGVTEGSCGEMHTTPLLSRGVCVRPSPEENPSGT